MMTGIEITRRKIPAQYRSELENIQRDLNIPDEQIGKIMEIAARIKDSKRSVIPEMLIEYEKEIRDPRALMWISYALGKSIIEMHMSHELPLIIEQAMNKGAELAIDEIRESLPEIPGSPEIPKPSEEDRMYI